MDGQQPQDDVSDPQPNASDHEPGTDNHTSLEPTTLLQHKEQNRIEPHNIDNLKTIRIKEYRKNTVQPPPIQYHRTETNWLPGHKNRTKENHELNNNKPKTCNNTAPTKLKYTRPKEPLTDLARKQYYTTSNQLHKSKQ